MNETIKTIYEIPEYRLGTLHIEIAKLNRRAAKLGVPAITLTETGNVELVENKDEITGLVVSVTRIIQVELVGTTPKFDGWTLAATLEHTEEGNIIRKVPSCPVDLMPFRTCKPKCEHCNLIRNRKDTYLVAHDNGSVKQVGHDCIRDFLGHKSPQGLAAMAELLYAAGELCGLGESEGFGGGGSGQERIYARTFMAYCARAIRQYGYVSRKAMEESEMSGGASRSSTKNTVMTWMFPPRDPAAKARICEKHCLDGETWPMPTEADSALVDVAREFVIDRLTGKMDLNEFENNLLICAKIEALEVRTCGIAAYVVEYYRRETEKAAEVARKQATANNTHFGEIKKRYRSVPLTYLGCSSFDSQFGTCFIHRFENAEGQRLVWKTGAGLGYSDGFKVTATFSVKEHGEFRGWNQTKITRLVVD
jgi:hypothetical protein